MGNAEVAIPVKYTILFYFLSRVSIVLCWFVLNQDTPLSCNDGNP